MKQRIYTLVFFWLSTLTLGWAQELKFEDYQHLARQNELLLELPPLPMSLEEMDEHVTSILEVATRAFEKISNQESANLSFSSTLNAHEQSYRPLSELDLLLTFSMSTQVAKEMRLASERQLSRLNKWRLTNDDYSMSFSLCWDFLDGCTEEDAAALNEREQDLFQYFQSLWEPENPPPLEPDLSFDGAELRKRLDRLEPRFLANITDANAAQFFSLEELDGVPGSVLKSLLQEDGRYRVRVNHNAEFGPVITTAKAGAVRTQIGTARQRLAKGENSAILTRIVNLRHQYAASRGYPSWADYQLRRQMAGSSKVALQFCESLAQGLAPKFQRELQTMESLKVAEIEDPSAKLVWWDYPYYQNRIKKEEHAIAAEQLRVYFEMEAVLAGVFDVIGTVFSLGINEVEAGNTWSEDVRLFVVVDSTTEQPLGCFYLDPYQRPGRYPGFVAYDILTSKIAAGGISRLPVSALLCDFSRAQDGEPTLLTHQEVVGLFHELGHVLQGLFSQSLYGHHVPEPMPADFAEVPSKLLESWAWDTDVLQSFAVHYQDPSKTIPAELVERMRLAEFATSGTKYRLQLALSLTDLKMHLGAVEDVSRVCQEVGSSVFLPVPEGTNFAAGWHHLAHWSTSYYGYLWSESIAADLATPFHQVELGLLDPVIGMKLRKEIFEGIGMQPPSILVANFLGRESNNHAFLKRLGIEALKND